MTTSATALLSDHLVTHLLLVLDESGSMNAHRDAVVKTTDHLVSELAAMSTATNQEWRISVLLFSQKARWAVWDMDVRAFPSINDFYSPHSCTALYGAISYGLDEMGTIPTKHGNHAFLAYVVTDGEEYPSNSSFYLKNSDGEFGNIAVDPRGLSAQIKTLDASAWTVAALVPSPLAKLKMHSCGLEPGNVTVWDSTTEQGVEEAGHTMVAASAGYAQTRASGRHSSSTLFTQSQVDAQAIAASGVPEVSPTTYDVLINLTAGTEIKEFITNEHGFPWQSGACFFEVVGRSEKVKPDREIAIMEKIGSRNGKVWIGPEARQILGLPSDKEVRLGPGFNPGYRVLVQSKSTNRKLRVGQVVLRRK